MRQGTISMVPEYYRRGIVMLPVKMEQQRFTCLNCQGNLRLDSVRRSEGTDDERSKYTEKENDSTESLQGQAKNLMKLICDAQCPSDAPVCGECSDELLVGMEKQLASLEEERASYQTFLDHLKATHSSSNISELKSTLQNLQDQEKSLENELEKLILEEKSIDEELQAKRKKNKASEQKSEHLWQTYRDNLRKLLEAEDTLRSVDSELRYADIQHRRLTDTNILDICFHIWVEGQIGEINGFSTGSSAGSTRGLDRNQRRLGPSRSSARYFV
ncbi:unnamed protein product [Caenorhabditis auriculariae]|uniref:Atg6/beclin coiled-coil domain-containing protein n=1 Tax=Caenorhabditis auriculariae TaxID=2777116 RepID=A0A8S1HND6_9PELO|nr:unnamed protein product [Caenorhabditis auriculariae]